MTTTTALITGIQLAHLKELMTSVRSAPTGFDWQQKTALMMTDDWRKRFLSYIYPVPHTADEPCFKGVFSHWDRTTRYRFEDCGLTRETQRENQDAHAELLCAAYARVNEALMAFLLPVDSALTTMTKAQASEWITALKNIEGGGCGKDGLIHTAAWYADETDEETDENAFLTHAFIAKMIAVIDDAAFSTN